MDTEISKRPLTGLALLALIICAGIIALLALGGDVSAQTDSKGQTSDIAAGPGSPECGPNWTYVQSPNTIPNKDNELSGVAALSSSNVWAVGFWNDSPSLVGTLTEHWDGTQWNLVASPNPSAIYNILASVSAIASDKVWAVGYQVNLSGGPDRTLTEHWNGSQWSVVPSPNPASGGGNDYLNGVAAVGVGDVWAVGSFYDGAGSLALFEHWDGTQWSVVSSPYPGTQFNELNGVAVVSANDVWAVGDHYSGDNISHPLIEHWNGTAWGVVTNPSLNDSELDGVAAVSTGNVWAVGSRGATKATLIEHWNGAQWSVVSGPNPGTQYNELHAVTAITANDVWAVGDKSNGTCCLPLVVHFDGNSWSAISAPAAPSGNQDELDGVAADSASDVWGVGRYYSNTHFATLTERYNPCPPTPTPTRTRTPRPTQTPGGPTATPFPTSCPIQFTDVNVDNSFYPYIRCLACRTIVGGYTSSPPCTTGTPCFLPGNPVSRGQMAKFVSNAANYQDVIPPNQQTFTDVPPNSTFWLYIERAYLHQVIGGYTTSPPCTTGTPCFLPGNDVTRGQTAKFVSIAANYQDNIPPNQQTFTDVPPNSTFWLYIERVYMHTIVGGYQNSPPCTTGTPCFLPGNDVTRGQTAKFISKAFFPNCDTP